jgi:hypothetical protein
MWLSRTTNLAAAAVFGLALIGPSYALDGRVIDGSTGSPLDGVYVIGVWWVSTPRFVESQTGCTKLEVTRTDEQGRFSTSGWSGRVLAHLFGEENLNVYYYKRGYRWEKGFEQKSEVVVLVPDTRTPLERIGHLRDLTVKADCGSESELKKYALPLYHVMYEEALPLASNKEERKELSGLLFDIERRELGYKQALENEQQRFFKGYP